MTAPVDPSGVAVPDDAATHLEAVVDRIEDDRSAVLLVGPGEVELVVDRGLLPPGTREGDWLRVHLAADPARTEQRRTAMEARLEHLRNTRRGGRFDAT